MTRLTPLRRSRRAVLAMVLLALSVSVLQGAWHQSMAFAVATNPLLAGVVCGGPLSSADVEKLVEIGVLPDGSSGDGLTLCDLLTVPAATAQVMPGISSDVTPARNDLPLPAVSQLPAAPRYLPPSRGPPART